jgi:hypothetical protein
MPKLKQTDPEEARRVIKQKYLELDQKVMACLKLMRGKRPTSGVWWVRSTTWPYTWMGLRLLECVNLADEIADLIKASGLEQIDLPANSAE